MTLVELAINRINLIIENGGIGVSDEVDSVSEQLIKILINLAKKCKYNLNNEKRITLDSFIFEAFNKKIKIIPTLCYYQDIQEFENDGNRRGGWIEPYKWIMIDIPIINGKVYLLELQDSVQHELEHAYQNIKMGHGFGSEFIYNCAVGRLYSKDIFQRSLAQIIYASTRNEQDAMINGLYAQIKNNREKNIDDIVKESEAFVWLQNLYKAKKILNQNKDNEELLKYIGEYKRYNDNISQSKFRRIVNNGIKELEWKLARLVRGAKKRFLLEFNVRPYVRDNGNHKNNEIYFLV